MWFDWILANPAVVLVVVDIILSIFQYKKTGKISFLNLKDTNTAIDSAPADNIVMKDLEKLIDYHEKMAVELKKKINK